MKKSIKYTLSLVFSVIAILVTIAVSYNIYIYDEVTRSKFSLIEDHIVSFKSPVTDLKEQNCNNYFKINLPINLIPLKQVDSKEDKFCLFYDKFQNKFISLTYYGKEWKKGIENQSKYLSLYNPTILSNRANKLKEEYQKEEFYFLKNKLIHDYFQNPFARWLFPNEAVSQLQMSTMLIFIRGNVYYQRLTNSFLIRESFPKINPANMSFLFFDMNNNVISLNIKNFNQSEIDSIFSSLALKGIQLDSLK